MPESFSKQYEVIQYRIWNSLKKRAFESWNNGTRMEEDWFPTKKRFDVFISHSHKDITLVKRFASWLNEELGLTCFIDSLYWENADDLLDFLFCHYHRFSNRYYACGFRDKLSSHVHAMLSMALMKMMDKTECVIFIKSDNALTRWENQTMSPWLYEEINFANMLRTNVPERLKRRVADSTRSFGFGLIVEHPVQIRYDVNFERFGNLYSNQLHTIHERKLRGKVALNAIYRLHKPSGNEVRD